MTDKQPTIFNMTHRVDGNLSIFAGGEWLSLKGAHAAYIYEMHDRIEKLRDLLEMLHDRAKIEIVNYKYEGDCEMVQNILNGK